MECSFGFLMTRTYDRWHHMRKWQIAINNMAATAAFSSEPYPPLLDNLNRQLHSLRHVLFADHDVA